MEFNFSQLPELIKKTDKNTIAVVATDDEEVIQALKNASKLVTLSFIFIGNRDNVTKLIHKYQLTGEIIHEQDLTKMGEIAVQLVREQKVNLIMKGLIDTKFLLKAVVNSTIGIKKFATLSHVAIFQYPTGCTLMATDCAMNISPDVQTKWNIMQNALLVAKALNVTTPKVGIVSAVEKVNPKIASTVEAEQLIKKYHEFNNHTYLLDGPFAIDNLVSMASVHHKNIQSAVAGKADILLFPDLVSGNVFYKTSIFLANAKVAGLIIGATVPIILTSRADSAESKTNSILLGLLVSQCN